MGNLVTVKNNYDNGVCSGFTIYTGTTYNGHPFTIPPSANSIGFHTLPHTFDIGFYSGPLYVFLEHCDNHISPPPNEDPKKQGGFQVVLIDVDCEVCPPNSDAINCTMVVSFVEETLTDCNFSVSFVEGSYPTPTGTPTSTETPTPTPTSTETPTPTSTETPTPTPIVVSDIDVFLNNGSSPSSIYSYNPNTTVLTYLFDSTNSSYDIANTSNKLWVYDGGASTSLLEYDITLNPFSQTFNRTITSVSSNSGLCAINDTTLINIDGSDVYELDITTNVPSATLKWSMITGRVVQGDYMYTTTNKLIVTNNGYITQYDYATGTVEVDIDISGTIPNAYGVFEYGSGIYIVDVGGEIYQIMGTSPYTLTLVDDVLFTVYGASQIPSKITEDFTPVTESTSTPTPTSTETPTPTPTNTPTPSPTSSPTPTPTSSPTPTPTSSPTPTSTETPTPTPTPTSTETPTPTPTSSPTPIPTDTPIPTYTPIPTETPTPTPTETCVDIEFCSKEGTAGSEVQYEGCDGITYNLSVPGGDCVQPPRCVRSNSWIYSNPNNMEPVTLLPGDCAGSPPPQTATPVPTALPTCVCIEFTNISTGDRAGYYDDCSGISQTVVVGSYATEKVCGDGNNITVSDPKVQYQITGNCFEGSCPDNDRVEEPR
jgi:hypothetical protein